jgi:hypothetical protein
MRELSDEAIEHEVEALQEYRARGGDVELWFRSKDFADGDEAKIRDLTLGLPVRQSRARRSR